MHGHIQRATVPGQTHGPNAEFGRGKPSDQGPGFTSQFDQMDAAVPAREGKLRIEVTRVEHADTILVDEYLDAFRPPCLLPAR